jgi:hypothetical protein
MKKVVKIAVAVFMSLTVLLTSGCQQATRKDFGGREQIEEPVPVPETGLKESNQVPMPVPESEMPPKLMKCPCDK